jgi:hypothetical protein
MDAIQFCSQAPETAAPNGSQRYPPPLNTNHVCLPPTPNPTPLCKPTQRYPTTWFTEANLELKYPTLNPPAADYTPQTALPTLPETNPQTHRWENTNHQLYPLAAEYNHPEPHPHTTSQKQQEETYSKEPTWEEAEQEDNPEPQ